MVDIKPLRGITIATSWFKSSYMSNLLLQVTKNKTNVFQSYLSSGAAVKDEPSVYPYRISFVFPEKYGSKKKITRTLRGFIALAKVDDLLRHEDRHEDAEEELAKSFKKHKLILSPIMAMFDDKDQIINSAFNTTQKSMLFAGEDAAVSEPKDSKHTLERISDKRVIARIAAGMKNVKHAIIADGHHRFGALKMLGIKWVPVFFVGINDENLVLMSWHRLIKAKHPADDIRAALERILSVKQPQTLLYRANNIEEIRMATHPAEYEQGEVLELERRILLRAGEPVPKGATDLGERPLGGRMGAFENQEYLVSRSAGEEWFTYWQREQVGIQRLLLFGLYAAYGSFLSLNKKYYLIGAATHSLQEFLKKLDSIVDEFGAQIKYKNEIGQAQRAVDSGQFHAAILVPVLHKQEIIEIAESKAYKELPAKFTCFLPKPGIGILIVEVTDLKKGGEEE